MRLSTRDTRTHISPRERGERRLTFRRVRPKLAVGDRLEAVLGRRGAAHRLVDLDDVLHDDLPLLARARDGEARGEHHVLHVVVVVCRRRGGGRGGVRVHGHPPRNVWRVLVHAVVFVGGRVLRFWGELEGALLEALDELGVLAVCLDGVDLAELDELVALEGVEGGGVEEDLGRCCRHVEIFYRGKLCLHWHASSLRMPGPQGFWSGKGWTGGWGGGGPLVSCRSMNARTSEAEGRREGG